MNRTRLLKASTTIVLIFRQEGLRVEVLRVIVDRRGSAQELSRWDATRGILYSTRVFLRDDPCEHSPRSKPHDSLAGFARQFNFLGILPAFRLPAGAAEIRCNMLDAYRINERGEFLRLPLRALGAVIHSVVEASAK